jgi:peptidyl-prolyl cis-trans isomerase C
MRLSRTAVALATLASLPLGIASMPAFAQTAPAGASAPAGKPADPLLAKVNGVEIHLSDLNAIAQALPAEARQLPPQQLIPQLLSQAIDGKALVVMAKKQKLDQDPQVVRAMTFATERTLETALVSKEVGPSIDEAKIRARYDATIAGKPGEPEVHAAHILVATEDQAKKLIAELKGGADFATLAKANSTDPGAANGGDLGFFKATDMLPEFSAVAFSLKPGEISDKPVQTRYGWHVIKVIETRQSPAPTFEQAHDQLRQEMIGEGINTLLASARSQVKIEQFNPDGTPVKATDTAQPPAKPPVKK